MSTARQAGTRIAPSDNDDGFIHEVSFGEWLWSDVLLRRVPRAKCGVLLIGDPDKAEPGFDALKCPRCASAR